MEWSNLIRKRERKDPRFALFGGRSSLAMFRLFTNEGGRGGEELTVHGEATYLEMIEAEIRKVLSFLVRTTVKDAHC